MRGQTVIAIRAGSIKLRGRPRCQLPEIHKKKVALDGSPADVSSMNRADVERGSIPLLLPLLTAVTGRPLHHLGGTWPSAFIKNYGEASFHAAVCGFWSLARIIRADVVEKWISKEPPNSTAPGICKRRRIGNVAGHSELSPK